MSKDYNPVRDRRRGHKLTFKFRTTSGTQNTRKRQTLLFFLCQDVNQLALDCPNRDINDEFLKDMPPPSCSLGRRCGVGRQLGTRGKGPTKTKHLCFSASLSLPIAVRFPRLDPLTSCNPIVIRVISHYVFIHINYCEIILTHTNSCYVAVPVHSY
jgi:hypothetical protein